MLRIDKPPAYFSLGMNVVQPGRGAGTGLIYRQCFGPVTMLYYVLKDPDDPGQGGDFLYAKSRKYASVPAFCDYTLAESCSHSLAVNVLANLLPSELAPGLLGKCGFMH